MLAKPFYKKFGMILALALVALSALPLVTAQDESEEEEEYVVGVQLVAEGFSAPVFLTTPNDGSGRLFVVDQAGTIRIIGADGTLLPEPFLDLTSRIVPLKTDYDERGVLGLAFHPDYANNGRFFVYYSIPLREGAPEGWDHTNVVGEFTVSADNPDVADPASEKLVLQIDQPQFNHNSGHIAFGPDGFLYIPIGDGGGANDTDMGHTPDIGNGQDVTNLHGSILRIDVNGNPGEYTIPSDNPFADGSNGAPEIYAYGLRNPYHISFDRGGSGELFVADAGQDEYEEVDIVTLGGNYGWNIKEATHCFNAADPETELDSCAATGANGEPLVDPIIEYSHDDIGVVVVGGYVYRGTALPDLEGYYIFGDYSVDFSPSGTLLWGEAPEEASDEGGMWEWGKMTVAGTPNGGVAGYVLALGEDQDGELYLLTSQGSAPTGDTGQVWKLVPAEEGAVPAPAVTEDAEGSDDAEAAGTEDMPPPAVTEQATEDAS
jgi:glucose/arabinose dehydrogenase